MDLTKWNKMHVRLPTRHCLLDSPPYKLSQCSGQLKDTSDAGHDNNNSTSSKLELTGPCSEIEKE